MSEVPSILLGDLMAPRIGSVDPSAFPDEDFDLYSIPAYDSGQPEVCLGSEIGSTKQVVQPGDVLLSKIVPHIRRAWIVGADNGRRIIGSGEWIVFRSTQVHAGYLRHVLVGDPFHREFMLTVSGVGGSLLRARPAYVAKIRIPLPPLPEQRRIAAILDQAEALRAKRRTALAKLDTLAQSIFIEMFGDPEANPKDWPTATLGDVVEEFRYGSSNKSQEYGKPALRIPNVIGGSIDLAEIKLVPVDSAEFRRLRLFTGDLLFVRTNGNPDNVGRCAVFDSNIVMKSGFQPDEFIFASYLIRARVNVARVTPLYLREFMLGKEGRHQLRSRSKTSAGQFNINTENLGMINFPLPPLKLQGEFERMISKLEAIKGSQQAALHCLDDLFASLQHRAFSGDL